MTRLISDEAVYRTAPATPGLLKSYHTSSLLSGQGPGSRDLNKGLLSSSWLQVCLHYNTHLHWTAMLTETTHLLYTSVSSVTFATNLHIYNCLLYKPIFTLEPRVL